MDVVLCADEDYALPLLVATASLAENGGLASSRAWIVDCGLSADTRRACARLLDGRMQGVEFLTPPPSAPELLGRVRPWISATTYVRLLLPDLLPDGLERVLYLDSDVVVHGSLAPLASLDLCGHPVAAVQDLGIPFVTSRGGVQDLAGFSGPADARYCNAGVLLVDLPAAREADVFGRALDYCIRNSSVAAWGDQEGLNAALAGDFLPLGHEWNALYSWSRPRLDLDRYAELLGVLRIRHFAGRYKPWAAEDGVETWGRELFAEYAGRFADVPAPVPSAPPAPAS